MHVFIDTNILLNFFHFSKDELDALQNVFASHEHGAAKVYLTQQVCDEFRRNRENKIKDAMNRFKEVKYVAQLPSFMKDYEDYSSIKRLSDELQQLTKSIIAKADADIATRQLLADKLIENIFSRPDKLPMTPELYATASMRTAIGNPPGKNKSIGDAINWSMLLQAVPDNEHLHIISADGDYYSCINEYAVHPFLEDEWKNRKRSSLFVYRTLAAFMKEHFDGVAFSFDKTKDGLIDDLNSSGSFAMTHQLVGKLEAYSYFSLKEVERILAAAVENSQFGGIVTDRDVSDFLNRIAVSRLTNIMVQEQREFVEKVIKEQGERAKQTG